MRRLFQIIALSSVLAGCTDIPQAIGLRRGDTMDRDFYGSRDLPEDPGGFTAPPDSDSVEDPLDGPPAVFEENTTPVVYVCGVDHPGAADRSLVVFRNGRRIAEYPANGLPDTALEADAHYLRGPDFYVAASGPRGTELYKNGSLYAAFPEREYISDLLVRGDGVWTLGAGVSGDGFCLRKDGNRVFSKSGGHAGRMYEDGSNLYFTYTLDMGERQLAYLVKDGDEYPLSAPGGGELLSAIVSGGTLWYLEDDGARWILSDGTRSVGYNHRPGLVFRTAELYRTPDGFPAAVISLHAVAGGFPAELVADGENEFLKGGGFGSYHYFELRPDTHVTIAKDMAFVYISGPAGENEDLIDSVRFAGRRCAMQYEGQLYLCCTPIDGSPPFVWKRGGARMPIKLEGYLTGICVEPPD